MNNNLFIIGGIDPTRRGNYCMAKLSSDEVLRIPGEGNGEESIDNCMSINTKWRWSTSIGNIKGDGRIYVFFEEANEGMGEANSDTWERSNVLMNISSSPSLSPSTQMPSPSPSSMNPSRIPSETPTKIPSLMPSNSPVCQPELDEWSLHSSSNFVPYQVFVKPKLNSNFPTLRKKKTKKKTVRCFAPYGPNQNVVIRTLHEFLRRPYLWINGY